MGFIGNGGQPHNSPLVSIAVPALHLLDQPAAEIVLVHSVVDEDNRAAWLEAVVDRARVPLPDLLADDRARRLFHVGVEIVEHDVVHATTHHAALDADAVVAAALLRVPFT